VGSPAISMLEYPRRLRRFRVCSSGSGRIQVCEERCILRFGAIGSQSLPDPYIENGFKWKGQESRVRTCTLLLYCAKGNTHGVGDVSLEYAESGSFRLLLSGKWCLQVGTLMSMPKRKVRFRQEVISITEVPIQGFLKHQSDFQNSRSKQALPGITKSCHLGIKKWRVFGQTTLYLHASLSLKKRESLL